MPEQILETSQNVQPDLPQISPFVPEKKSNTGLIVVLLIVMLLIVAGAVYTGIMISKKQPAVSNYVPEPVVTPAVNETATWQTYKNSQDDFEFQYPKNGKITQYDRSQRADLLLDLILDFKEQNFPNPTVAITFQSFDNPKKLTLQKFIDEENNIPQIQASTFFSVKNSVQKIVGGESALYSENAFCEPTLCSKVILLHQDKIYLITYGSQYDQLKTDHLDLFTQILSTFKFTDQKTDETGNWKTYTITTEPILNLADYQIKLPPTWVQIAHSSNFQDTETFQDTYTNFIYQLIVHQEKNINPQTSKPYSTLKELTGLPYDVTSLIVDGKSAVQVQPRAGSESYYKVLFFSKDNKLTFSVELDTPRDGSKIQEGGAIFTQILSTFKFLD